MQGTFVIPSQIEINFFLLIYAKGMSYLPYRAYNFWEPGTKIDGSYNVPLPPIFEANTALNSSSDKTEKILKAFSCGSKSKFIMFFLRYLHIFHSRLFLDNITSSEYISPYCFDIGFLNNVSIWMDFIYVFVILFLLLLVYKI